MSWETAKTAAWATFGQRWWKVIVGFDIAKRAITPVFAVLAMAAAAYGVHWVATGAAWIRVAATVTIGAAWGLWILWRAFEPTWSPIWVARIGLATISLGFVWYVWW